MPKAKVATTTLATFYRRDTSSLSGHDPQIAPGDDEFSMELERLSRLAPERGIFPVTVDPRLNRRLIDMDAELKDPDEFKAFINSLGLVPPPHSRGNVHVEWLPDEDPNAVVGIFAWGIPNPADH